MGKETIKGQQNKHAQDGNILNSKEKSKTRHVLLTNNQGQIKKLDTIFQLSNQPF